MKDHKPDGAKGAPRSELIPGLSLLAIAAAIVAGVFYRKSLPVYLTKLGLEISAPFLLAGGAFLSNYFSGRAIARGVRRPQRFVRRDGRPLPRALDAARATSDRARIWLANVDWTGDWLPLGVMVLTCLGTLYLGYRARLLAVNGPTIVLDQWLFGGLVAICFPILVLERRVASLPDRRILGRLALTMLLRLLLANLLLFAVSYLLRWLALPYTATLEGIALLATGLVAAEILLRNVAYLFMPLPPLDRRPGRCESLVASLLQFRKPSLSAMRASVSHQFGIDLGRSWSIRFIRNAAAPFVLLLVTCGWLMTGITALGLGQRAVYEAFGRPQGVFYPGLHVYLPWPFGTLRRIDYGTVREIPIVFPAENGVAQADERAVLSDASVEGEPPNSADRLWDTSHPSEASYLVASNRNGKETFEVVNIDLRILYRVGLGEQAAWRAAYRVNDPDALIRAAAGRMLARYFARYTIPDILGQNRERFIRGFQAELQSRLNALSSGLDIIGVVVEAIHPPAGAAAAYQDVQAAGIRSITAIATAKGDATRLLQQSQADTTDMLDKAQADAAEAVDQATVDTAIFAGDAQAHKNDGAAFMFERRLLAVVRGLSSTAPVDIIDNRIPPQQAPVISLLGGSGSGVQYVPVPSTGGIRGNAGSDDDD